MRKLFSVEGKVVIVTGGSRGLGAMMARSFVENGAKVYISSRNAEMCDARAAELSEYGTCVSLPFNLGGMDGIEGLAAAFAEREPKLDVLINNAGAVWASPIEDYQEKGWDKVLDINVKAVFFLTQKLLPQLRAAATASNPARVINIASANGVVPPPLDSFAYSTSKAGCIMLTRHLAKRLAPENILVNAITPGPFATQMMAATLQEYGDFVRRSNPLRRLGEAEDIAGVAMFLSSRASNYTTGAAIPCDGGMAEF
ncbi:SDR family oxidoreductase [Rhodoferax sp. UBA5149]|uniref:SDR family oxidoreductase n=1 Tax=Rhodoferax sp. UBA5149 TaxID=1947379 RepID=UPI0025CD95E5|nr:SDR family oxidoreductase [Rhodoferax sp. UBA5149]